MKDKQHHEKEDAAKENSSQTPLPAEEIPAHTACEEKIKDLTNTLQRLQAEFDNFRKRTASEQQQKDKETQANVLRKFLPIIDSFQLSLKSMVASGDKNTKGMELLYAQFSSALEEQGVRAIQIIPGKDRFDPYKHEVLMTQESDLPDHTILEEFQRGYWFYDTVLRTSKIVCAVPKRGESHERDA